VGPEDEQFHFLLGGQSACAATSTSSSLSGDQSVVAATLSVHVRHQTPAEATGSPPGHCGVTAGSPLGHGTPAEAGDDDEKAEADEADADDGRR